MSNLHTPRNDIDNDFMSVTDASKRLQVDPSTVRRWIYAGFFPNTVRVSPKRGEYRIPIRAVEIFEESRRF